MVGKDDFYSAAHQFDGGRLTVARELAGFTKTELAALIEKTPSAVTQFESSRVRPDVQTVKRIALALGVTAGFFGHRAGGGPIALDACHFRSLRSASQRDRRKLLAVASILCDLILLIEQEVQFPQEQVTLVQQPAPEQLDAIEAIAGEVRKKWGLGLGPIPNVIQLLESKGILVNKIPEGCEDVDAFSMWQGKRPCIFLTATKGSSSRTRFDAAHELGHLVMHADVVPGNRELEQQANRFASAFLVPRDAFLIEAPRRLSWAHFQELKRRWRVSIAALVRRSFDLGSLSEASYRRAHIQLSQMGWRREGEPDEPPVEASSIIPRGLEMIETDWPRARVADELGITEPTLASLVSSVRFA